MFKQQQAKQQFYNHMPFIENTDGFENADRQKISKNLAASMQNF